MSEFKPGDKVLAHLEGEEAEYFGTPLQGIVHSNRASGRVRVELLNTGSQDSEGYNAYIDFKPEKLERR